ncbi:unnamed protein product (macronuclear) [Paramecium tetraurelia]|uniref:Cystatin domain-containing protein n=1 Tax=Paramecium tetraurelia TaxID=5888 RepID=A0BNW3_PARTE|nr:uncharacterized protein GSPATT00030869001 [Paramecium tetraurelia]CAK60230.1 unnamed protein product [Paramecium tetraurelia]|eukprot:XP_001427628.1 hypothetical protein (macronuclear) [Paramecium tetraurelia strain d4-2]
MKVLFVLVIFITIQCEMLLVSQDDKFSDDDNDFVGGVFPTTDSNSDTYNKALQYAQEHYAESCKLSDLQWESLDGSKNQMVQGMLYYFNVTLKGKERQEKYEIQVWIQANQEQSAEITQCKQL